VISPRTLSRAAGRVWAETYQVVAQTGAAGELPIGKLDAGSTLTLPGRTVAVLQVD
jgi:glycogen debranching enzyme